MVIKTSSLSSHAVKAHKHVEIKAHHAKPFRKRHVGLLIVSLALLVLLASFLVSYRNQLIGGLSSSKSFVSDLFGQNKTYDVTVNSSYGFNLRFDQKQFYGSAISNDNGDLYIGGELAQRHAYTIVRIAPNFSEGAHSQSTSSAMTFTLHPAKVGVKNKLDTTALLDGGIDSNKVIRGMTVPTTIGGITFQKTTWQSKISSTLSPALSAKFVTYAGLVHGNVFTIVINLGVVGGDGNQYDTVLKSISFDNTISYTAAPTDAVLGRVQSSRSLLDVLTSTNIAAATSGVDLTGSEKVAALYAPAVVRIWHAYAMDVSIDGKPYLRGVTEAASGSGFFVSQDGYLATNGHVASMTPQDVVITNAIANYASTGDPALFNHLISLTTLRSSDIPASSTELEALGIMIDAFYKIDASRFTATNNVDNLLVQVKDKNPDITTLLNDTKAGIEYPVADTNVIKAKLVAANYRAADDVAQTGFKASDVAIIKVDGSNYPLVKLGSIDSAIQGSDISILGFPGNASKNGLVESGTSTVTLTTGKVSSIKNAAGSDKKLIETTATIGHGNSGGPVINNDGEVVGIATYTSDGATDTSGTATYNYIRNIKDFTDLALARHITFDTNSATQVAWQKGMANFYSSHYSKALKNFAVVQDLYPNDSRVAEFTAGAQKRIAAGQDVVDFPLVPVLIASFLVVVGIGLGVFFIVRHHKKHSLYRTGIAEGTLQPVGPGVKTQTLLVAADGSTFNASAAATYAPVAPIRLAPEEPVSPPSAKPPLELPHTPDNTKEAPPK